MGQMSKANIPISDACWNHWESKRLQSNINRPPMPKVLPQANRTIYDPPWIWSKTKYTPNLMSFIRRMIEISRNKFASPYDSNKVYTEDE